MTSPEDTPATVTPADIARLCQQDGNMSILRTTEFWVGALPELDRGPSGPAAPEPHPKAAEVETRFGTDHRDVEPDVEADAFAGWLIWLGKTDTPVADLAELVLRFRAQFKGYGPTAEDAMAAHWQAEFKAEANRPINPTPWGYTMDALRHIDWPALTRAAMADNWTSYETPRGAHVVICNY